MRVALSRRALIGGAGKAAAVAALGAVPAVASAALAAHADVAIIEVLHGWCAAVRACASSTVKLESPEWLALEATADSEIKRAAALPVQTIEGLAIKSYLAMHHEYMGARGNLFVPDFEGAMMKDQLLPKSVYADFARLSPILAAAIA